MSASLYVSTAAQFVRGLENLSVLLEKGAAWAKEKGLSEDAVLNSRLAEDMFPLARQVQLVSDAAKGAVARLAGLTPPSMEDTEKTFAELQGRIAKTIEFIHSVKAEQLEGDDARPIVVKMRSGDKHFTALEYVLNFATPNVFFHITTAYAILRHEGVNVGKMDYLGAL